MVAISKITKEIRVVLKDYIPPENEKFYEYTVDLELLKNINESVDFTI